MTDETEASLRQYDQSWDSDYRAIIAVATLAGTFRRCGYKFGRWYDMVWMEKILGEHRPDQPPVQPYIY